MNFGSVTKEVVKKAKPMFDRARGMGMGMKMGQPFNAASKPMMSSSTMVRNRPAPRIATDGATIPTGGSAPEPKKKSIFSTKRRTVKPLDDDIF